MWAKDAKNAQNLIVFIVLPVLIVIGVQVTGLVWFDLAQTLGLALGVFFLDYLVLRVAVKLFQREEIVLKWQ